MPTSDDASRDRYQRHAVVLMTAVSLIWTACATILFLAADTVPGIEGDLSIARWMTFGLAICVIVLTAFTAARATPALLVTAVGHALVLVGLYLAVLMAGSSGLLASPWYKGLAAVGVCFAAVVTVGSAMAYRRLAILGLIADTEQHAQELQQMAGTRLMRSGAAPPVVPPAATGSGRAKRATDKITSGRQALPVAERLLDDTSRGAIRDALRNGAQNAYKPGLRTVIEVDNLVKHYGPIRAVDGISFTIDRGEIIGFLGPNGAGKSTTMKIITTWLGRTAGRVVVGGNDLDDAPLGVREKIGYLPESTPLYRDMRVSSYLNFIGRARRIAPRRLKRNTAWVREACGLTPVWNMRINELSKGYRQRVGLAQAMIHEPEILILDEPSSGLDPNQIVEIRELIRDLGRDDRAIVLSTHILQEVTALCSRVMIIAHGQLVANGTVDELCTAIKPLNRVVARVNATKANTRNAMNRLESERTLDIQVESGSGADTICRIEASPDDDHTIDQVVADVSQILVDEKIPMLELRREQPTLEDVFVTLTHGVRT